MLLSGKGGERMYRGYSCREIIEKAFFSCNGEILKRTHT